MSITHGGIWLLVMSLVLVCLIAFVPPIRDSDVWGPIVAGLLGAALAAAVSLFLAPEVQRRARRDERRDEGRSQMRRALVTSMRTALSTVSVAIGVVEAAENESGAHAEQLKASARDHLRKQLREVFLDAHNELWFPYPLARDSHLDTLWKRYEVDATMLMGLDAQTIQSRAPQTPSALLDCHQRVEHDCLVMSAYLYQLLTGDRESGHDLVSRALEADRP